MAILLCAAVYRNHTMCVLYKVGVVVFVRAKWLAAVVPQHNAPLTLSHSLAMGRCLFGAHVVDTTRSAVQSHAVHQLSGASMLSMQKLHKHAKRARARSRDNTHTHTYMLTNIFMRV